MAMAIGSVTEEGASLVFYDEHGRRMAVVPLPTPSARLQGYTPGLVSVRSGEMILLYDEHGRQVGLVPACR
jgi:hypothetical protein